MNAVTNGKVRKLQNTNLSGIIIANKNNNIITNYIIVYYVDRGDCEQRTRWENFNNSHTITVREITVNPRPSRSYFQLSTSHNEIF